MTPRALVPRARAEAFARAVDGGRTDDEWLARLAGLTTELRRLPRQPLRPDDDFRADLRTRLLAEAEARRAVREHLPPPRRPADADRPHRPRATRIAAGALAATLLGGTGVALASTTALPGELLYPVKRGVEQVRLTLAAGDAARGSTELDLARTRLDEAEMLLLEADSGAGTARTVAALDEFTAAATTGTRHLLDAYAADGDTEHLDEVVTFVRDSVPRLERMRLEAPPEVDAAIADALTALTRSTGQLRQALASCGAACRTLVAGLPAAGPAGTDRDAAVSAPGAASPTPSALPSALAPGPVVTGPAVTGAVPPAGGDPDTGGGPQLGVGVEVGAGEDGAGVEGSLGSGGLGVQLPGGGVSAPAPAVTSTVAVPLPSATLGDTVVDPGPGVGLDPGAGAGSDGCTLNALGTCLVP